MVFGGNIFCTKNQKFFPSNLEIFVPKGVWGYSLYKSVFTSFRLRKMCKNEACEGTQAVLAMIGKLSVGSLRIA